MWRQLAGVVMNYRFRRPALVFLLGLSFLLGVALARRGAQIDVSWWWLAALGVLMTIKKQRVWCAVWIIALGLSLGWWRGGLYVQHLAQFEALQGQKITLVGRANGDAVYDRNKQLTFDLINPRVAGTGEQLTGKVAISGFGTNAVFANDEVHAHGKIRLARGSYQARMSYSQMSVVAHHPTLITEARSRFNAGMESALPEPIASFAMGLLIGQRNTLPDEVSQTLLMVGLTHIIAVSGYNLTVLLRASRKLLGKVSKRQATMLALGLIAVFLLFAGASASIVRAAIVSVLSIAAAYYGRSFKPLTLIVLAAAITAY
ncbi:MAG TPA: ComEC/Rec2 family competence protein, partial [Candidatus Saccharimonadales bacterium]|nr:ComEC/Rec2 family competence protein [Candidatus Saccharimonadales bacterium]